MIHLQTAIPLDDTVSSIASKPQACLAVGRCNIGKNTVTVFTTFAILYPQHHSLTINIRDF
jgi:hypothetical protein